MKTIDPISLLKLKTLSFESGKGKNTPEAIKFGCETLIKLIDDGQLQREQVIALFSKKK